MCVFFLCFANGVLFGWGSFTVYRLKFYGSFVTTWHYEHFHWKYVRILLETLVLKTANGG